MNFIKATIATAAVITCCLGNNYPAKADMSQDELIAWRVGKNFGYSLGLVSQSCVNYVAGDISRNEFRQYVEIASRLKNVNQTMREMIVDSVRSNKAGGTAYRRCLPVLTSVMGNGSRPGSAYSTTEYWR